MLDQNTDRMWYVIGAVIVGAALIFLMNGTFPTLFANIGETFEDKVSDVTAVVNDIGNKNESDEYPTPTDVASFTYMEHANSITITKYVGTDVDVVIPKVIDGKAVTEIGENAFYNGSVNSRQPIKVALNSVVIPDSVTTIGESAFSYNQLTEVVIPDSVTSIGNSAFSTNELTDVVIPDSVTTIRGYAFQYNQLTEIEIPDSVTTIGIYAFSDNQLTKVVISDSVTSIGAGAFSYNQLTEVVIPNSVTKIGSNAFDSHVLIKPDR